MPEKIAKLFTGVKYWRSIIAFLILPSAVVGAENGRLADIITRAETGEAKAQYYLGGVITLARG